MPVNGIQNKLNNTVKYTPDELKVIEAGKEFVMNLREVAKETNKNTKSDKTFSFGNKSFDMTNPEDVKEYKKTLHLYAKGAIEQIKENHTGHIEDEEKKKNYEVTILDMANIDTSKLDSLSLKERVSISLFETCDFSHEQKGKLGKENGKFELQDMIALMAYVDASDGKIDGKASMDTIKSMALTNMLPFNGLRDSISKLVKTFNLF